MEFTFVELKTDEVCFAFWFRDQMITSFTLLPMGWLDSWDPHPGPQQLQTHHCNILMNIKTSPRSHSLIGLHCQVPNSEPSMVAVGMTYTDLSWTWVQSPIRQVEVETGPNLRDWEMGISGSFKENWGAVTWKKVGARQQKQLIFIATGLYWL